MAVIQYQGRPAQRESSEQRRRAILDAALAIIVRDGIRNVRHRAVAKEAEVPLSATTYYFKDIGDLIVDCFTLFAEQAMETVVRPIGQTVQQLIEAELANENLSEQRYPEIVEKICQLMADYIQDLVQTSRNHLIAEQAFLQEATLDQRLQPLAVAYIHHHLEVVAPLCEALQVPDAEQAANIIWNALMQLEFRLLIDNSMTRDDIVSYFRVLLQGLMSR